MQEERTALAEDVLERARKIRLFLMDVDGTITQGGVCLLSLPDGTIADLKIFNSHDGAGLKLASIMGLRTGFITGRESTAVTRRAQELSVEFVYQKQATKQAAFAECLQRAGVEAAEVAYMGDDLPDLPPMERSGLAIAVADAVSEVKAAAHYVTRARGGEGAAREVVELILKAQDRWAKAVPLAIA